MNFRIDVRNGAVPERRAYPRPMVTGNTPEADSELFDFLDDASDTSATAGGRAAPWVVLVVDDDRGVHDSTVLALAGERVHGRPLSLLHAYSAAQAWQMLTSDVEIALVLLDVVMETHDAGVRLVADIRSNNAHNKVRIIIRTGQPGRGTDANFPQSRAIDGYLTKARLTRSMLLDTLVAALGTGHDAGDPTTHN